MSEEPKSETAAKIENGSVIKDPNECESKELLSIYSAAKIPTGTQKRTYSAQCGSPKSTLQEQNNSPMMNSCNCKPMPLYYSCPRNSGGPTQCAGNAHHRYATMPLPGCPCSPNDDFDDLWNLQFCRWWGWNWIRKREEEMMNKQKESTEIRRRRRGLHRKRSRSRSKTRKKPPKKDDFFTWCRRLCRGGEKQNQLKPTEKEQLKELYATPCCSITSPGGMKDLENQSLHFVGEYGCSCSDTRQICTPVPIMPCRTRRQECKYNIRKHQSWVCEKAESSSSDECCQHISACPRRSSNSTTEESIEYLTLRMECITSDCEDDREYQCKKLTPINGYAKSPRCSCDIEQNCVCGECQQKTSPIKGKKPSPCCTCGSCQQKKFRIKCKKPSACCTGRECEQSPCKCSSTVWIPRLRKCLPPCKRQQCYNPCEYQTPKCFLRRVKQPKCNCCQKRKEYIIYCPCQVQCKKKCRCRQANRAQNSEKTDKPENKLVATSSNTSKSDDVGTDKIKNEKLKEDHRGTIDKCVGAGGPSTDINTPHKCPYSIMYLDNNTSGDTGLQDGYICNFMQRNISKGAGAGVYASPATGRIYSLNPKILTARSVSHKSHLPGPINFNVKTLAYNSPIQLPKIDKEHKLLLTAVCEAILTSRASSKESDLEVNRDCYSTPETPVSSYEDDYINKNFHPYKNMKAADSYEPLNHDQFLLDQNSDKAVINNWNNRGVENRNETEFNITSKLPPNNQNMFDSYYSKNITSSNFLPLSSNLLESFTSGKDAINHKQSNMVHNILQKISCPEEPNQQRKKNVLFQNTAPQQLPPLIPLEKDIFTNNNIRNISSEKLCTENNLSRDNIYGKKLTEKLISAVDSCALLKSWRKGKTTKPIQNSRGSINAPKSIYSHCSPICNSLDMPEKTLVGLHNRYSNLTKPKNTFLDASCDFPQNLMNTSKFPSSTYMSAAKSPAKEITEEYRYKKDLLEESDKTQHYNVFFSTVHTNIGDDISNFSHNSRSALPPSEYPLAVLEQLSPSINEQTQTSHFLLKAPVLICEDSSERKLRCINLNEKYSFLTNQTQVSTSKQIESKDRNNNVAADNTYFLKGNNDGFLPIPNSTTTSKSGSVYDVENNRPLVPNILKLSENTLDNKIKYNHSENELICFNLNQRVCPYASQAKTSRSKATCGVKNKQTLPQSTLIPSKEYNSSTITYQLENEVSSVLPNSLYSPGASVEIDTTPTSTSGTNEQYLENDILEGRSEENNTARNGVQCSSINNEENFYPNNALTKNFTTKDSSEKQFTKEDMIPYEHLESELLCLNLNEASSDLCRYDVSWIPHSGSLNNVKPRRAHSQAELQSHSMPQNMNVVNFSDPENIVAIINRTSKEYLNDLGFIAKNLQSYSSISDTSSIKSKLKESPYVDKCILCQPVPYTREVQYSSSDFTIDSSTSLPDLPIQPQPQETFLVNASTSPFRVPFEPELVVKPYVDSTTSPFKFEYVKMRVKDKEPMPIDYTRRKIMKRESAFSMFCLPVLSKEAVVLSTQDSNMSLSRPERKIVVDKPKRLNIREKRWPF